MLNLMMFLICLSTYIARAWPNIKNYKEGFTGMIRTFSVIGERLSPFVAVGCIALALSNLFYRQ
jgi:hypothetical protein